MSTIAQLREFFQECPFLKVPVDEAVPKVYVDYLSETPSVYGINIVPTNPWVRKYVDGGGVKQVTFVFRSLAFFGGTDILTNIDNIAFYQRLAEWLEETRPTIPGWIKVEPLTEGYIFDVSEGKDKASYQIQCRVLYTA